MSTNLALTVKLSAKCRAGSRRLDFVITSFSTIDVSPQERVDFWREMVRRHFVPLHVEPLAGGDFEGSVRLRAIGDLDMARVRAHPMLATRTRKHIERSASDEYFIGLHLRGVARAEQDGRVAILRPGDFTLIDSARPYRIAFGAAGTFDHVIVRIPREHLDARVAPLERTTALTIATGSPAGRIATPAMRTLVSLDAGERFVDPILDLIAAAIRPTSQRGAPRRSSRQRTIAAVKRYTLAHLGDSELSPSRVALACFISPRQLHRVFEGEGTTFGAFVREARLRRVRDDVSDPALAGWTIAEIGRRYGFSNPSVLTRAFTRRYGEGPRASRRRRLEN